MTRNHIIISGTGRAGTTFLVQLFTELGMSTGFQNSQEGIIVNCNAGMELDLHQPDSPYIVKSPWLCDYLEELLQSGEVHIYQAIIPIRNLFSAAESRRFVSSNTPEGVQPDNVPGGLWHTQNPDEQEKVLSLQLYKLIFTLVKYDIPTTFLFFPKFVHCPKYLYSKLPFLLKHIPYDRFVVVFRKVSRPELVHKFKLDQDEEIR
jgi:hypothetical protein